MSCTIDAVPELVRSVLSVTNLEELSLKKVRALVAARFGDAAALEADASFRATVKEAVDAFLSTAASSSTSTAVEPAPTASRKRKNESEQASTPSKAAKVEKAFVEKKATPPKAAAKPKPKAKKTPATPTSTTKAAKGKKAPADPSELEDLRAGHVMAQEMTAGRPSRRAAVAAVAGFAKAFGKVDLGLAASDGEDNESDAESDAASDAGSEVHFDEAELNEEGPAEGAHQDSADSSSSSDEAEANSDSDEE